MAARLSAVLGEATGVRWTIALSAQVGELTLAEQGSAADTARRQSAAQHPLVQAILAAFPGAKIEAVHDSRTDAYGLPAEPASLLQDAPPADDLEFAPPDEDGFNASDDFDSWDTSP